MKKLGIFFSLSLILLSNSISQDFPQDYFISPVDFPIRLSANFGELRTNAFHAGIDIRTGGVTGKKILAVADGFVYRIRVSPVGYGRALYVEHANGLASVYAHLDSFSEEIERYIKQEQYKRQSFDVDLTPARNLLRVKQGDVIGLSGNTGSSFGPHLHFEIREASTQMPVNPLLFNFDIRDNLPPVLYTLAVYPVNHNSRVNGKNQPLYLPLTGANGKYRVQSNSKIEVFGEIGFGIQATDFLNDSPNRCGAWSVELHLDNQIIYSHELTKFAFGELRYINAHIDYAEKIRNRRDIQRMFLQPNNKMSIYGKNVNRGIGVFNNKGETEGRIIVKDAYKNSSELIFSISTVLPVEEVMPPPVRPEHFAMLMRYDQPNNFTNSNLSLSMPANSLYDDLLFEFRTSDMVNGSLTPVYHIHDRFTPVHRSYSLSIRADNVPPALRDKALIVQLNDDKPNPLNSQWKNGYMHGQTNVFGMFTVMADTLPPVIEPLNISPGRNMSSQSKISFRVRDDLSGIKSYRGLINDEWVLFEFDPKNDLLFYIFDHSRIGRGQTHELQLTVTDQKDNASTYSVDFYY
ncbi:MAG: M23 family metallopeptidase [Bacteroidales bacterium]